MLLMFVGHIRGHPVPWLQELPAIHRRRPQQIIFVNLTASTRYAKSTLTHQRCGPGQRIGQEIGHLSNQLIGDTPTPLVQTWMEDWASVKLTHQGHPPPHWHEPGWTTGAHKPMYTHHLNLSASRLDSSNVRMSPSQTGPFMLHMMQQLLSSKNLT